MVSRVVKYAYSCSSNFPCKIPATDIRIPESGTQTTLERLWFLKWFLNTNEALKVFGINHQSAIPIEVTDSFHLWKFFKFKMISFRGQGKSFLGRVKWGHFLETWTRNERYCRMNWKEDRREKVVEKQFYKRNQIDNHYDLRFCMDDLMVYKKNIFISIYKLTFNNILWFL